MCAKPYPIGLAFRALLACLAVAALGSAQVSAGAAEGRITRAEFLFRATQPCPATGRTHGLCKGYVIDRIIPIICGGEDAPSNMRWLTTADAKAKAKWDRIGCRAGRKYIYPSEAPPSLTEAFAAEMPSGAVEARPLR